MARPGVQEKPGTGEGASRGGGDWAQGREPAVEVEAGSRIGHRGGGARGDRVWRRRRGRLGQTPGAEREQRPVARGQAAARVVHGRVEEDKKKMKNGLGCASISRHCHANSRGVKI